VQAVGKGSSEVRVATTLSPIGATGTYAQILAGETPALPGGFELPNRLLNQLHPALDVWQAATLVLEWASDNIAVDVDDTGDQDAVSVLGRGRGRCSGLANATVALLRAAGFEARTISGLLVTDREAIPHRWIECHLPGAGWVASDPTLGLWTVTPRHLVFADTVVDLPAVRVMSGSADGLDRLPRRGGRLMRPNQGADLLCRLASNWQLRDSVAVLRGGGGEVRRSRFDPEAHFSDLLPGVWVLEVESAGTVVETRRFDLRAGDFRSYLVDAEADGAPRGSDR
jgi:transglutaminase-like putative cysteine protease